MPTVRLRALAVAAGLVTLALLVRFALAPQLVALPADYASETTYDAWNVVRDRPTGPTREMTLTARRVDQTLSTRGCVSIIEAGLDWSSASGELLYQTGGLYGVDCRTRENIPGLGATSRHGQFLMPPRVRKGTYALWDAFYSGPRTATFDREDRVAGLAVYVFRTSARGLDDTAGLAHLPDVPERYRAHSDGDGTLWVEPVSGIIVDLEDHGESYFVVPGTGVRVAQIVAWRARYTEETRARQVRLAAAARRRALAAEAWVPSGILAAAGVVAAAGALRGGRGARGSGDAGAGSGGAA